VRSKEGGWVGVTEQVKRSSEEGGGGKEAKKGARGGKSAQKSKNTRGCPDILKNKRRKTMCQKGKQTKAQQGCYVAREYKQKVKTVIYVRVFPTRSNNFRHKTCMTDI